MQRPSALSVTISLAIAFAAAVATACHDSTGPLDAAVSAGLKPCGAGTAMFTVPPIDLTKLGGWVPLGNLNPPAHTFPTDHQYLYLPFTNASLAPAAVDVVAPAKMFITRARRTTYSTKGPDYSIEFSPCTEVHGEFGHVTTVVQAVLGQLGAFDQGCNTYSPDPATIVTACYTKPLGISIEAGAPIGTAGGAAGVLAMDFSLFDSRVTKLSYANASRWQSSSDAFDHFHVVAASDYFAEPAKSQVAARVGAYDGRVKRTVAPLGGTIETDVAGSAQGAWFSPGQPTYPESPHLAIVPDNVDPTQISFSFGTSQPGTSAATRTFTPASSGTLNRNPSQIAAGSQVYCYQFGFGGIVLVQLVDASTLRVEGRGATTSCGAGPYVFTTGATFDYVR
jgi:hypothetical protein